MKLGKPLTRRLVLGATLGASLFPRPARTQPLATKSVTIGVLEVAITAPLTDFTGALRELGYEQGRNLAIEYRSAEGRNEDLPKLAAELVSLKPDVIVASSTPAVLAVKQATGSIPIVMIGVGDPVQTGLVQSLAHPGANVTGRANGTGELAAKRLQLVTETLPGICCVTFLINPANPGNVANLPPRLSAAKKLGIEVNVINAANPDQLDQVLAALLDDRFKALEIAADALFVARRVLIAKAALSRGVAAFGPFAADARAGFLLAYGINTINEYPVAAVYVDKILKGAKPADLPIELPTRFTLAVNLKTAKTLGIAIPPLILSRADEVIE